VPTPPPRKIEKFKFKVLPVGPPAEKNISWFKKVVQKVIFT
jgi:hypothetical protein